MKRRGFTLIELLVAGVMAAIVLGAITLSLSQLGSSKAISRQRLEAYSRCDMAMRTLRKDIITTLRRGDLFHTRVLISDSTHRFQGEVMDKDELLLFDGTLRANKEIDFNGEGMEYETQFRIETNDVSSALWKRRDAILDDNPIGGGMATPISNGVIALQFEAFDGISWFTAWDSDEYGMPHALRITVTASGMDSKEEIDAPLVTLRTVVPLDRYQSPDDKLVLIAEEVEAERLAMLGIEPEGEGDISLDSGGASGAGGDGKPSNGGGVSGDGGSSSTRPGDTIIITDPDGNDHEIPNDP